jgi:hypothetical protein
VVDDGVEGGSDGAAEEGAAASARLHGAVHRAAEPRHLSPRSSAVGFLPPLRPPLRLDPDTEKAETVLSTGREAGTRASGGNAPMRPPPVALRGRRMRPPAHAVG